jgi:hypothetical protein
MLGFWNYRVGDAVWSNMIRRWDGIDTLNESNRASFNKRCAYTVVEWQNGSIRSSSFSFEYQP